MAGVCAGRVAIFLSLTALKEVSAGREQCKANDQSRALFPIYDDHVWTPETHDPRCARAPRTEHPSQANHEAQQSDMVGHGEGLRHQHDNERHEGGLQISGSSFAEGNSIEIHENDEGLGYGNGAGSFGVNFTAIQKKVKRQNQQKRENIKAKTTEIREKRAEAMGVKEASETTTTAERAMREKEEEAAMEKSENEEEPATAKEEDEEETEKGKEKDKAEDQGAEKTEETIPPSGLDMKFVRYPHYLVGFEAKKVVAKPSKDDKDTLDYKIYLQYRERRVSPWHDIPYAAMEENGTTLLHFVCEIPKGTARKYEIVTTEGVHGDEAGILDNPIMQDRKKNKESGEVKLREYKYPENKPAMSWNYGAVPQTWEDPQFVTPETSAKGDDDPIDVVQLNDEPCKTGDVQVVRPLGIFALIDDGETDWKMLVVDVHAGDAASKWKKLKDVSKDTQAALIDWFKKYKIPEGKGENKIAMNEEIKDEKFAGMVALDTHKAWCKLAGVKHDPYCTKTQSSAERVKVLPVLTLLASWLLVSS